MKIEPMLDEAPKSTCHQALPSAFVAVTEPSRKFPSVLPSTAAAAPVESLSAVSPTIAVLPSPESATEVNRNSLPTPSVRVNSPPCWLHPPFARTNTHADGAPVSSLPAQSPYSHQRIERLMCPDQTHPR